jgi:hypothetical protein
MADTQANPYGPKALTGPFADAIDPTIVSAPHQSNTPFSGYAGKTGNLLGIADRFLAGLGQGRMMAALSAEKEKAKTTSAMMGVYQELQNDPHVDDVTKAQFGQKFQQTLFSDAAQDIKKTKGQHPILDAMGHIITGLAGGDVKKSKQDPKAMQSLMGEMAAARVEAAKKYQSTQANDPILGVIAQTVDALRKSNQPVNKQTLAEAVQTSPEGRAALAQVDKQFGDGAGLKRFNEATQHYANPPEQQRLSPEQEDFIKAGNDLDKRFGLQPQPPGASQQAQPQTQTPSAQPAPPGAPQASRAPGIPTTLDPAVGTAPAAAQPQPPGAPPTQSSPGLAAPAKPDQGKPTTTAELYQNVPGLIEAGNINLINRPVVKNPDGTSSTVRTMTIEEEGHGVLLPTIINGKQVTNEAALEHYHKTGEHMGKFPTEADADKFDQTLHNKMGWDGPPGSAQEKWQKGQAEPPAAPTSKNGVAITIPQEAPGQPGVTQLAFKNNNPGNLRLVGQNGAKEGEGGYAKFKTPEAGYKALLGQIKTDADRGMTLAAYIGKYAPPTENDTATYVANAAKKLGVKPDTPVSKIDRNYLAQFQIGQESSSKIGGASEKSTQPQPPGTHPQVAATPDQPQPPVEPLDMNILDKLRTRKVVKDQAGFEYIDGKPRKTWDVAPNRWGIKAGSYDAKTGEFIDPSRIGEKPGAREQNIADVARAKNVPLSQAEDMVSAANAKKALGEGAGGDTGQMKQNEEAFRAQFPNETDAQIKKRASDLYLKEKQIADEAAKSRATKAADEANPKPITQGSREFRVAQDLAYGRLTMNEFRSLTAYSRDVAKKMDIYDKARELNPNFNPAAFEMGYSLAKNPRVQQQLASLDNVKMGVDSLLEASDAATRTGATILNKAVIPAGIAFGGQKYSNFATARTAFADELSGALGYGSATDMSREMGFDMTNPNLSPDNFRSAIQDIVVPFVDRKRQSFLKQMGVYGLPGMNPSANQPQPPGTDGAPADANNPLGLNLPSRKK